MPFTHSDLYQTLSIRSLLGRRTMLLERDSSGGIDKLPSLAWVTVTLAAALVGRASLHVMYVDRLRTRIRRDQSPLIRPREDGDVPASLRLRS
jgi:hypothetical protein